MQLVCDPAERRMPDLSVTKMLETQLCTEKHVTALPKIFSERVVQEQVVMRILKYLSHHKFRRRTQM